MINPAAVLLLTSVIKTITAAVMMLTGAVMTLTLQKFVLGICVVLLWLYASA